MKLGPLWDPALDALAAETRAFNAKLPKEGAPARWTPEAIAKARDLSQIMGGVFATKPIAGFEERTIDGPAGPIRLRVFVPPEVRAVYLDIHGGGFFMGAPEMDDVGNAALAKRARVATVATSYRLAPEHPYPAGPDDCEAAALWLLANAKREFGVERLLIGGGSAGANLAAVTLLRLRDRHQSAGRFAGANLVFGVYDVSGTPSQLRLGMTELPGSLPAGSRRGGAQAPGHLAALRRPRGAAAGALHRGHGRLPLRRLAVHGDALARGRQRGRAGRVPRLGARLHRLPDGPRARRQRPHHRLALRPRLAGGRPRCSVAQLNNEVRPRTKQRGGRRGSG